MQTTLNDRYAIAMAEALKCLRNPIDEGENESDIVDHLMTTTGLTRDESAEVVRRAVEKINPPVIPDVIKLDSPDSVEIESVQTAPETSEQIVRSVCLPNFLRIARRIVDWGAHVVPVNRAAKRCTLPDWQNLATRDFTVLQKWSEKDEYFNVGVVGKQDGLWVFDCDDLTDLAAYENEYGEIPTLRVQTVSGGLHLYFKSSQASWKMGNLTCKDAKGKEAWSCRVNNRYVVGVGSVAHPKNDESVPLAEYKIVEGYDFEPVPAPETLVQFLIEKDGQSEYNQRTAKTGSPDTAHTVQYGLIPTGSRNTTLASLAGKARQNFRLSPDELYRYLSRINEEQCRPPLPDKEVLAVANSCAKYDLPGEVLVRGEPVITDSRKEQFITGQIAGPDEQQLAEQTDEADNQGWQARVTKWLAEGVSQEEIGERFLKEVGATALTAETRVNIAEALEALLDDDPINQIPAFDPSVMTGIYKKIVELATRNTTLLPQYAFLAAKTLVGMLASSKFISFGDVDAMPRFYSVFIGDSGAGKGCAYKRVLEIFQIGFSTSRTGRADMKIINSADSGAGLKDCFFEAGEPSNTPVLMYIDELRTLGNKSAENRNPDIMDTIYELADCTSVSRILSKRGGKGSEVTNDNAQLSLIACVQNKDVIARALTGRNDMGSYDRLTPEYSVRVRAGKLPKIDKSEAGALTMELVRLLEKAGGGLTTSSEAYQQLESFWDVQPANIQERARFRRDIWLDAYLTCLGEGRLVVSVEDIQIAIRIFSRQLAIRAAFFGTEIPDKTGHYLRKIKDLTDRMTKQLEAGTDPMVLAMSKPAFEKATNATRDNEEHFFAKAWQVYAPDHLESVRVVRANGREYRKFLPVGWGPPAA